MKKSKKYTKEMLEALRAAKNEAVITYSKYLKEYNKEHGVEGRNLIQEIIELHKSGVPKAEIIERGYNKNTVQHQIYLFEKGKRVQKTTISKFLPPKVKKEAIKVSMK